MNNESTSACPGSHALARSSFVNDVVTSKNPSNSSNSAPCQEKLGLLWIGIVACPVEEGCCLPVVKHHDRLLLPWLVYTREAADEFCHILGFVVFVVLSHNQPHGLPMWQVSQDIF